MSIAQNYPALKPSLLLDFSNVEQLDPRITFTRASTATYFDQLGVMQTAASNVARFDYNPTTFESLGLLIEEQRTNLCTSSEVLSAGSNATITNDVALSPMGTMTADLLTENTANTEHYASNETISFTAGTTYASTAYIKNPSTDVSAFFYLRAVSPVASAYVFVRTSDMTIQTSAGVNIVSSSIQQVNDGYWRVSMIWTAASTGSASVRTGLAPSVTLGSYIGTGKQMLIACRQTEAGAFATSYIPTVASQVTRAADAASMTGTNFSSWYNQAAGALYADFIKYNNVQSGRVFTISDSTANNQIRIAASISTNIRPDWQILVGGAVQANIVDGPQGAVGSTIKSAGAYTVNNFGLATNGVLGTTDTSGTTPVVDRMQIGASEAAAVILNGTIRKIAYYPLRVTDAQLQALTS